jgi:hypothetical protein
MQRLFSMFPTGLPGLALLLLRASVALALVGESYSHRQELSGSLQAMSVLVSIALAVGWLTPIAAILGLVFQALIWSDAGVGAAAATIISLDAVALAMLGPGAYSVDSYLFGRRVVVLPPT